MANENLLLKSMTSGDSRTQNNCVTNSTTSNDCVDLFFTIGAMRSNRKNKDAMSKLITMFDRAFDENPLITMKILFWSRDIRGGAGERDVFRQLWKHITSVDFTAKMLKANRTSGYELFKMNMENIPEYGRWDDLFALMNSDETTPVEDWIVNYIVNTLKNENDQSRNLLAKWLPRTGGKTSASKKLIANKVRHAMKMNPAEYRKFLVSLTKVVETAMCQKEWGRIDYEHVPSVAMSRYMKAFGKNDGTRFTEYVQSVQKGEKKMNASAVYPYDVFRSLRNGGEKAANAMWSSLPNYLEGNTESIMPMVDVSGSMSSRISGEISAMDVSVSLGVYVAERMEGAFKDHFITFTSQPTLQRLTGTLSDRIRQIQGPVGFDTNIEAAFKMLLNSAVKGNVPQEHMPAKILIISDMEFNDSCISGHSVSAMEKIKVLYEQAGYKRPDIIFWKVNILTMENCPVKYDEQGTALISGFSPSILTSLLGGDMTPVNIMLKAVNAPRYDRVKA